MNEDTSGIGYGRPPKETQFRKGTSGNPKGRPKGTKDFASDVRDVLTAPVTVTENGRPRKVSSQRAALMRLREKALNGDGRSLEKLLELAREQAFNDGAAQAERRISGTEEDILQRYVNDSRIAASEDEKQTQFRDKGETPNAE
jgi:hypothetical protein